jgi:hypothetical protein
MNKKGDLDLSLKAIIGIVFGIIFLLIIFPLIEYAYDIIVNQDKDDIDSFVDLVNRINDLKDNENIKISSYVASDHCFVAFNKNQQEMNNAKRGSDCVNNKVCICRCLKQASEVLYKCDSCVSLELNSISFEPICGKKDLILNLEKKENYVKISSK